MNVHAALKCQYHATMSMLKQTIECCPEDLWVKDEESVAFWRVAYHALFFTHLYLYPSVEEFRPWEHHRDEYQFLGVLPFPPHRLPRIAEPYTKAQLVEYWTFVDGSIDALVDRLDLDAMECGFPWYKLPKLDRQINNIRHVQHHTALLAGRLRRAQGTDVEWVGFKTQAGNS